MAGPDSLRLGFLGHRSFTTAAAFLASRRGTGLAPNPGYSRIQKTFSAGPCSFSTRELWFPGRLGAAGVQPVSDSRHGRIACKVSLSPLSKEQRAAASNQSYGSRSNPFHWLATTLKIISSSSLRSQVRDVREQSLPIRPMAQTSNPIHWLAAALTKSLLLLRQFRKHPAGVVIGLLGHHVPRGLG
jgi:hypothetical protein